jgi:hypothetical protein
MMSVGMHPRILGHPGRLKGLANFVDHIAGDPRVWVCRRSEIASAFRARVPAPGKEAVA